ncbi:hypothetical protein VTN02DRAFT_6788 [Thermoascus thermophilus]
MEEHITSQQLHQLTHLPHHQCIHHHLAQGCCQDFILKKPQHCRGLHPAQGATKATHLVGGPPHPICNVWSVHAHPEPVDVLQHTPQLSTQHPFQQQQQGHYKKDHLHLQQEQLPQCLQSGSEVQPVIEHHMAFINDNAVQPLPQPQPHQEHLEGQSQHHLRHHQHQQHPIQWPFHIPLHTQNAQHPGSLVEITPQCHQQDHHHHGASTQHPGREHEQQTLPTTSGHDHNNGTGALLDGTEHRLLDAPEACSHRAHHLGQAHCQVSLCQLELPHQPALLGFHLPQHPHTLTKNAGHHLASLIVLKAQKPMPIHAGHPEEKPSVLHRPRLFSDQSCVDGSSHMGCMAGLEVSNPSHPCLGISFLHIIVWCHPKVLDIVRELVVGPEIAAADPDGNMTVDVEVQHLATKPFTGLALQGLSQVFRCPWLSIGVRTPEIVQLIKKRPAGGADHKAPQIHILIPIHILLCLCFHVSFTVHTIHTIHIIICFRVRFRG